MAFQLEHADAGPGTVKVAVDAIFYVCCVSLSSHEDKCDEPTLIQRALCISMIAILLMFLIVDKQHVLCIEISM